MAKDLEVKVTDFVPEFVKLMQNAKGGMVFKHTINALNGVAEAYQAVWVKYAQGAMVVPGAKVIRSRGPYAGSIQIDNSKPYKKTIFTDYEAHKYIEQGHGEIDLKPGLLRGGSARYGKHGAYNIVAFRHDTPGAGSQGGNPMPVNIYKMMLQATQKADQDRKGAAGPGTSRMLTSGSRPENRSYEWGGRLDSKLQQGRRSKVGTGYTWKAGKYAGMVRAQESTSAAQRTGYITFRVVSSRSAPSSWIVPPQDPIPIRQATVDFVNATLNVEEVLKQAIERDLS